MSAYRQVADRQIDDLTDKDTGIDRQTGGRANGQAGMHTWLGDWEPKILDPSFEYDDIRSPHSLSVSPQHYFFLSFFSLFFYLFNLNSSLFVNLTLLRRPSSTKYMYKVGADKPKRGVVLRERERKLTPSSSKSPFSQLWIPPFFVPYTK